MNEESGGGCFDERARNGGARAGGDGGQKRGEPNPTTALTPAVVSKVVYKNVSAVVLEDVYEPAEDTFLLADCAADAAFLFLPAEISKGADFTDFSKDRDFTVYGTVYGLEIGCGSGFVSEFVQEKAPFVHMTGVDINPNAVMCSRQNGVRACQSDMFEIFELSENEKNLLSDSPAVPAMPPGGFDLILFNPPYLPTAEDEKVPGNLNYAFDGGVLGRDSIDRFLAEAGNYLADSGFFLLLISSLTGLDEVMDEMRKNGFSAEICGRTKVSFEELFVLKGKPL
ncbi:MAG: methyltransferase [Methanimicrococcus sp.]|nr:methyltransferase [Methanimicrococcus sp.]